MVVSLKLKDCFVSQAPCSGQVKVWTPVLKVRRVYQGKIKVDSSVTDCIVYISIAPCGPNVRIMLNYTMNNHNSMLILYIHERFKGY